MLGSGHFINSPILKFLIKRRGAPSSDAPRGSYLWSDACGRVLFALRQLLALYLIVSPLGAANIDITLSLVFNTEILLSISATTTALSISSIIIPPMLPKFFNRIFKVNMNITT